MDFEFLTLWDIFLKYLFQIQALFNLLVKPWLQLKFEEFLFFIEEVQYWPIYKKAMLCFLIWTFGFFINLIKRIFNFISKNYIFLVYLIVILMIITQIDPSAEVIELVFTVS